MMLDPDLPDELQEVDESRPQDDYRHLQSVGSLIADKRDAAVKAREASGIEAVWTSAEEAYAGIDDNNRSTSTGSQQWRKPTASSGPLTRGTNKADESRSTAYVRLTTRYVDMASAKVKEKALPIDDKPFGLKPTPVPEPVAGDIDPAATAQPVAPVAPAHPGQPPSPVAPVADAAKQAMSLALVAAEKSADRIYDWWIASNFATHIRRVIDDSARIGVGVLKGPFPTNRKDKAFALKKDDTGKMVGALEMVDTTQPGLIAVDPWNFFPAGNCGENIHDGDHVFERGYLSESKLLGLKNQKGLLGESVYLADQIDIVVSQGPDKCKENRDPRSPEAKKNLYEVWYFTGQMSRKDMIALKAVGAEDLPDEVMDCFALVTLVNDTVIQAQFNPLEKSGHFPYRTFPWARRAGSWAGVGVAEQCSLPQAMANAGTRSWLNNAGVSAGAQVLIDLSKIYSLDGSNIIGGGVKLWGTLPEATGVDLRQAMATFEIPNMGKELKEIIDYAFKLAEELTNIPLVSQGQTGKDDPQTFGQAELQNSNANTLLRQIADNIDTMVKEMVDDFYEWLLLDPDVPDSEKGDFDILASGCSAMVEKSIQEQTLLAMGPMTLNPAYGLSPARWAEQYAKSKRMNPELLQYTDEEKAKMQSQPPPEAPAVTAAKINAGAKIHGIEMQAHAQLAQVQAEAAHEQQLLTQGGTTPHMASASAQIEKERIRSAAALQVEASRSHAEEARANKELEIATQNGQFKLEELRLQKELALLEYANKNQLTLMQVKADLAKSAMDNQTKKELAATELQLNQTENHADRSHDMSKHVATMNHAKELQANQHQAEADMQAAAPKPKDDK